VEEIMRAGLARFRAKRTGLREENASNQKLETTTPAAGRALSVRQAAEQKSAAIGSSGNARNVRTIKADIGQFAIAELGQFADIALIIPERLDHADERE
jgi:hypothetical protein